MGVLANPQIDGENSLEDGEKCEARCPVECLSKDRAKSNLLSLACLPGLWIPLSLQIRPYIKDENPHTLKMKVLAPPLGGGFPSFLPLQLCQSASFLLLTLSTASGPVGRSRDSFHVLSERA